MAQVPRHWVDELMAVAREVVADSRNLRHALRLRRLLAAKRAALTSDDACGRPTPPASDSAARDRTSPPAPPSSAA